MVMRSGWFAVVVLCFCSGSIPAELELHQFTYHEGFEGDAPRVTLWAKNGESEENFIGPSDEKAFEGKRSLKFDVSLKSGSYHYWGVEARVPCAGKVRLSARMWVSEETTATVGFGTNCVYPPTVLSGCGAVESYSAPTGEWKLIECDLVARGRSGAADVTGNNTATTKGENVGAYLDRWVIFVYGGEGKRAIVYLDDVRIEGEVPDPNDYDAEVRRRWEVGQQRLKREVNQWRNTLAQAETAFQKVGGGLPQVSEAKAAIVKSIERGRELIGALEKRGYGSQAEVAEIQSAIDTVRFAPETIDAITRGTSAGQPYLLYAPPTITNVRFPANVFPIPAAMGKELSCSGCRGEYESVSAALYALEEIKGLKVSVTDLAGSAGLILASEIDIFVVKSWYQAGRGTSDLKNKMLVPELLLKDDRLVRVDLNTGENYLRSTALDGSGSYLLCSGRTSENLAEVRPIDAAMLQPVDIPSRSLKQFWINVHIPESAKAGEYRGALRFTIGNGSRDLPFRVTVHPFDLAPSKLTYSIYYRATLSRDGLPTITSEYKSAEQYRAEVADLKAHGVLYPSNYEGMGEKLRRVLEIRQEVGLPGGKFFTLGQGTGATADPGQLTSLRTAFGQWIDFCQPFGYDSIHFYGIDEAAGERLKSQQATWRTAQEAGGKTFVACYARTFEAMGSLLNVAVLAGRPDPEEAKKWHSVGSQAFCYAYPQVGNEEPETYRRNFGLVLWKAGFDGAMDYAYQHGFGHVWNDFDNERYRDHNFTYPTVNGIVGTIQWEGFREAVDDVRYVTTLEQAIKKAHTAKKALAKQAQSWLDSLDPDLADLNAARAKMAEWIERLMQKTRVVD